jgi:hypothetical protein
MRDNTNTRHRWWAVAATALATAFPAASQACITYVGPTLEDVRFADVVVVGRVSNYRIVRDEAFRRQMLASPHLTEDLRKIYEDPRESLLSDYARFDVQVEEVLVGRPPNKLSVTWDNSTFGEPGQMAAGPYLIALRRPGSASLPLRGPSATIRPSPDLKALTLLQAPCSGAFIYEVGSEQARTIRKLLEPPPR